MIFTTADFKLVEATKKKRGIIANYFSIPVRWIYVQYAQNGFACVKTLHNDRQFWVKIRGNKIISIAPVV